MTLAAASIETLEGPGEFPVHAIEIQALPTDTRERRCVGVTPCRASLARDRFSRTPVDRIGRLKRPDVRLHDNGSVRLAPSDVERLGSGASAKRDGGED